MSVQDHQALDDAVLVAVKGGANRASGISASVVANGMPTNYRAIDRSLQRLRKNGSIRYQTGSVGWTVEKVKR